MCVCAYVEVFCLDGLVACVCVPGSDLHRHSLRARLFFLVMLFSSIRDGVHELDNSPLSSIPSFHFSSITRHKSMQPTFFVIVKDDSNAA